MSRSSLGSSSFDSSPFDPRERMEQILIHLQCDTRLTPENTALTRELSYLEKKYPHLALQIQAAASTAPLNPEEVAMDFSSGRHWNLFVKQCPTFKGFREEANSIVRYMTAYSDELVLNGNRYYAETCLVQWALQNMPAPTQLFMQETLKQFEIGGPERWTISAFKTHLQIWVELFESPEAADYAAKVLSVPQWNDNGRLVHRSFYANQQLTGGGWMAHLLYSSAEHQRWALQLFRQAFNDVTQKHGGIVPQWTGGDTVMQM